MNSAPILDTQAVRRTLQRLAHEIVEATSDLGLGDADLAAIITVIEQRLTAE